MDRLATVSQVRAEIENSLDVAGINGASIHIAEDPIGGFWVRVVHDRFKTMSDDDRRGLTVAGLSDVVTTAEILSPDEEAWYGPPFRQDQSELPAWPEVLARSEKSSETIFASDLDAPVEKPAIVTFYSLRGGVGRSTSLVAAAQLLASRGRRILCIDMDFEAPGLSYLMGVPAPADDVGSLALLMALEQGDEVDVRDHVSRVSEVDELYCMPAGALNVAYAERLRLLNPEIWYRESSNALHRLIDLAAESTLEPDVIILDSRTGISPISAPLLFDVSDLAVVCFFPHEQAKNGTALMTKSLLRASSRRSTPEQKVAPEPRFLVTPIPPGPSAERVIKRSLEWVDEWMGSKEVVRPAEVGPLIAEELVHVVPYSADIAFSDRVETSGHDVTYGAIADWIEQFLSAADEEVEDSVPNKDAVLRELDFSAGSAEHQDRDSFIENYVQTRISRQATDFRTPLVIGRKGTGKTAVFRWLLENSSGTRPSVPVYCPAPFRNRAPWMIGPTGFATLESELSATNSWSVFWICYTVLAMHLSMPANERVSQPERLGLDLEVFSDDDYDELAVVDTIRSMLASPDGGLLATRWLLEIDRGYSTDTLLLFDGLDTGFGNDDAGRMRRTEAVSGLLTFLTEVESRLKRLKFKIMLRFDIWQQLRFENKSHLFGRSVQLVWRDQNEFFKTALKQALRSPSFMRQVERLSVSSTVDDWDEHEVRRAWNILVGERMKGGKTTFTRNWVWNRLADGRGDHGPRALSQLFREAVRWEQVEEGRNSYDRSIIRPRALVPSLDTVSEEAVQALSEEFPELQPLVDTLKELGRTPVDAADVSDASTEAAEGLELALETGLLAIYEGTQDDVLRYRVPELFRRGLGMTRRGQA